MLDSKVVPSLVMWVIIQDSCSADITYTVCATTLRNTTKTEHAAGPVMLQVPLFESRSSS
jgi:hypothetical protein